MSWKFSSIHPGVYWNFIPLTFDVSTIDIYWMSFQNMTSPVTLADDSVCRLYEVGLLKDEDDDQVRHLVAYQ